MESHSSERVAMARSVLVKDTTREERAEIVRRGLSFCGDGSCEQCSGCSMGVGSIDAMYQPYIDGRLELAEVNMLHAATTFTLGGGRSTDTPSADAGKAHPDARHQE